MADRMRLEGRTAVITGAASGIGRAVASALARRGCHLALADIDEAGLTETARRCSATGVRVSLHHLDVADRRAVADLPALVTAEHDGLDLLVNNAGVAVGGTFEQISEEDFDWLFAINFGGVVRMTRAFLPLLRASDDARIVNVSSAFGLVAPAGQTAYAASKFAVRGFSEALRHELQGSRVGVTVVHPGGVATAIVDRSRRPAGVPEEELALREAAFKQRLRMPADRAGEIIVRGIERRRGRVLVGSDAVAMSLLARLAPARYWKALGLLHPR
jgi:NAD(P)-dependent dehydrogenase (short-subunit alcohol dehydrogenase family)